MPSKTYGFTVTGWKALIALAIFGGWYGLCAYMNTQPVSDDQLQTIEEFLTKEYSGNSPQDLLLRLQAANAGQPVEPVPAAPVHVNLNAAAARGNNNHVIVRVEVNVDGAPPPDGHTIRFLSLSRQAGKWVVLWNSNSNAYSRALWARP